MSGQKLIVSQGCDWAVEQHDRQSPSAAPANALSVDGTTGNTSIGAGKTLLAEAGAGGVDLSLATGPWKGPTGTSTYNGKVAAAANAWVIADPGNAGAIAVTAEGVCNLTSAGAETRTLAAPTFNGQRLVISMDTDGGDIVVTVSAAYNQAGNTTVTLNDAGDHVELVCATIGGVKRWRIVNNDGCTLG